jgi:hypothetical protein
LNNRSPGFVVVTPFLAQVELYRQFGVRAMTWASCQGETITDLVVDVPKWTPPDKNYSFSWKSLLVVFTRPVETLTFVGRFPGKKKIREAMNLGPSEPLSHSVLAVHFRRGFLELQADYGEEVALLIFFHYIFPRNNPVQDVAPAVTRVDALSTQVCVPAPSLLALPLALDCTPDPVSCAQNQIPSPFTDSVRVQGNQVFTLLIPAVEFGGESF